MKIGIDCDDVLLDCNTSLALFHNARYGTSYERKNNWSWNLERIWGCTKEEAITRVKEWYVSLEHEQSLPMPGSIEAVRELAKSHSLYLITSRPGYVKELTQKWLEKNFSEKFAELYFTNYLEPGGGSKAEACRKLGVSVLIEDHLTHARDVAAIGIPVLLLDSPWNQEAVSGNIIRVFTWKDVLNFIQSIQTPAI